MLLQVYFFKKHLVSEIMKEANGVNPYHMTITNFPKYFILLTTISIWPENIIFLVHKLPVLLTHNLHAPVTSHKSFTTKPQPQSVGACQGHGVWSSKM